MIEIEVFSRKVREIDKKREKILAHEKVSCIFAPIEAKQLPSKTNEGFKMTMTSMEYFAEVQAIAAQLASDAMQYNDNDVDAARDWIFDSALHEAVDGHQWIIYYAYSLDVIKHSDNSDYYIDEFGADEAGDTLKRGGLSGLHTAIAYWALHADVASMIDDELRELESAQ